MEAGYDQQPGTRVGCSVGNCSTTTGKQHFGLQEGARSHDQAKHPHDHPPATQPNRLRLWLSQQTRARGPGSSAVWAQLPTSQ